MPESEMSTTLSATSNAPRPMRRGLFTSAGWLAMGGALFVGNVMALVRPPERPRAEGDLEQAPRGRSISMAALGFVVAIAALAVTLLEEDVP